MMADTSILSVESDLLSPTDEQELDDWCIWSDRFPIASILSDPVRWNSDWEKALRKLPASDVYAVMSTFSKAQPAESLEKLKIIPTYLAEIQTTQRDLWNAEWEQRPWKRIRMAWLLLEDKERQRLLLNALVGASKECSIGQSARALCPEITVTAMSKIQGRALLDFLETYHKNLQGERLEAPFCSHSAWWAKALPDADDPAVGEPDRLAYNIATWQREEFICQFVRAMLLSISKDMAHGSAGMDKAKAIIQDDPMMASMLTKTVGDLRKKPIIRCENCTKSQAELDNSECQKEDWRRHKKHCGKAKISKKLPGTIHDPYWAIPDIKDTMKDMPDYVRDSLPQGSGNADLNSLGFGKPHPSLTITPALRRQMDLYTSAKDVDYFVFDELDRPFPFLIEEVWTRLNFRNLRGQVISSPDRQGVEAIAQYVIKRLSRTPGFSRDLIVRQFEKEYGDDVGEKLRKFDSMSVRNGYAEGDTFIEITSRSLGVTMSKVLHRGSK
ncbi:hypothetical protein HWV62_24600 [Athelia sp. TMB]|nr:hypothetical protein HWV62_24600 [Athelia sp. TMB]